MNFFFIQIENKILEIQRLRQTGLASGYTTNEMIPKTQETVNYHLRQRACFKKVVVRQLNVHFTSSHHDVIKITQ